MVKDGIFHLLFVCEANIEIIYFNRYNLINKECLYEKKFNVNRLGFIGNICRKL